MTHPLFPHQFMQQALKCAELGRYTVSPNPMVGCLIVKDNQIIGQGSHRQAGEAHAEIMALKQAGVLAKGATVYVTLEPCSHQGRTPPCTAALIHAGVKTVYAACQDPNPLICGQGFMALKAAGIEVITGLCEQEAQELNEIFFHYITTQRPFVIAKWAMSLDGHTVTHSKDSRFLSGEISEQATHALRQAVDAIVIGAATAIKDNPLLTVRNLAGGFKPLKQPCRFILSTHGDLPLHLKLFDSALLGKSIVVTTELITKKTRISLEKKGIEYWVIEKNQRDQVDILAFLKKVGAHHMTSLLVEGGEQVHADFFENNLINKIHTYLAPVIVSRLEKKRVLKNIKCQQSGKDFHFIADVK